MAESTEDTNSVMRGHDRPTKPNSLDFFSLIQDLTDETNKID